MQECCTVESEQLVQNMTDLQGVNATICAQKVELERKVEWFQRGVDQQNAAMKQQRVTTETERANTQKAQNILQNKVDTGVRLENQARKLPTRVENYLRELMRPKKVRLLEFTCPSLRVLGNLALANAQAGQNVEEAVHLMDLFFSRADFDRVRTEAGLVCTLYVVVGIKYIRGLHSHYTDTFR